VRFDFARYYELSRRLWRSLIKKSKQDADLLDWTLSFRLRHDRNGWFFRAAGEYSTLAWDIGTFAGCLR